MTKPVARLTDINSAGGPIFAAVSGDVLVNNKPAAMIGSQVAPHIPFKGPHKVPSTIITGSTSVLVNGRPLAHIGSMTSCGHPIALGSSDVLVGTGAMSVSATDPYKSPQARELVRQNGPAAIGLDQPPDTPANPEPVDCGGFSSSLSPEDYNKKISNNYTLADLSIRAKAGQHYIKEQHGLTVPQICCSLSALAVNIIEAIRVKYPGFNVNSAFRTAKNGSDHERGFACDLQWPGIGRNDLLTRCQWASENLPFYQIIYEAPPSSAYGWLHISYNGGKKISGKPPVLSWFGSNYIPGLQLQA